MSKINLKELKNDFILEGKFLRHDDIVEFVHFLNKEFGLDQFSIEDREIINSIDSIGCDIDNIKTTLKELKKNIKN